MNETSMNATKSTTLQTVGAIFAGILVNFLIAVPIDLILHAAGVFPGMDVRMTDAQCAIALSYRIVAAIVGGYLVARLAPYRPMKNAMILGCIGVVLSTAGSLAMGDVGPRWYPLMLIAISIPASWAGAKIRITGVPQG